MPPSGSPQHEPDDSYVLCLHVYAYFILTDEDPEAGGVKHFV